MWRQRAILSWLGGSLAVACLVPDVPLVKSFGDGGGGTDGSEAAAAGSAMGERGGAMTVKGGSAGDAGAAGDGTELGRGGTVSGGSAGGGLGGAADNAGGAETAGAAGASALGCGDGTRATEEACDDGNTLACGTCSANCRSATPLGPARGTFSLGADAVLDGETFLLDDGFGPVQFEFDDNQVTSGGEVIPISLPLNVQVLRDAIVTAVNAAPGLGITAAAGSAGTVVLTNDHLGAVGNHAITDLVSSAAFAHTGMSGGAGHDCPNDSGCFNDDSCASVHCEAGVCVP